MTFSSSTIIIDPIQESYFNELLIRVNSQDEIIGSGTKRECHELSHFLFHQQPHRAFSVFLFGKSPSSSSDGGKWSLLMQKRSATKVTFPLLTTNTCCSHPWFNDEEKEGLLGVKKAAIRKLNHELGIPKDEFEISDFQLHSRIHYKAASCSTWGENEIDYVLVVRKPNLNSLKIEPNLQEVEEARWIARKEFVKEFVEDSHGRSQLTPWVKLVLEHGLLWSIWDAVEKEEEKCDSLDFEAKMNGSLPPIQSFI